MGSTEEWTEKEKQRTRERGCDGRQKSRSKRQEREEDGLSNINYRKCNHRLKEGENEMEVT